MAFTVARAVPLLLGVFQLGISTGRASAVTPPARRATLPPRVATIQGRVTERETGQPVASAQLIVVGTRQGGATNNNGEYSIAGVAPGQIQLRVSRIGFQPMTQAVTVPATGSVTLNFSLERAVARLEEVITTATGEQSRREFGNAVASVKMDTLAKIAPVTNVAEMLQARVAGLQVFQGPGVTGANEPMRIRGLSSLSLGLDPLMIVDGVRYDNGTVTGSFATSTTRVGDLNPEEIESIDVIKGPSAAALYGIVVANGVIIIKMKCGVAS